MNIENIPDEILIANFNDAAKIIHTEAKRKGFWDNKRNKGELLMLVVSELGEALEADRKNRYAKKQILQESIEKDPSFANKSEFKTLFERDIKDTFEDEIADAIIRLLDLAAGYNIDIDWHINNKFNYNKTRKPLHGKAY